ncbi:ATP-grasp domain-containing protein [Brucepastera parasyntrophica]|uniref:ATP-grasp domain-containing protein n=1 Tax=Brucepastera parasyntrophica TaxID=2880008 RepID=UPI00210AD6C8|nr:ATP-grasp domain-containing protein [Brucepastera parasyntrophica]ULQ60133.1 ATP-grasp domain-containing protein [Brucepastera parasyntrophica]
MKKRILLLGAGFMQGAGIRSAKQKGWEVIAADGNPEAACAHLADHFEHIDLKDTERLCGFAGQLKDNGGLDGVFTCATDFSSTVAFIAEKYGLPGHSHEAALNATDKIRMRECFQQAAVPSPKFTGVHKTQAPDIRNLLRARDLRYPLVVKPADNMGSRGCRRADTFEQLEQALSEAFRYSKTGTAIVEEYMDGPEFSIEALIFDGEFHLTGLADRHIYFPPFFVEMGHTMPSSFPEDKQQELVEVFIKGIKALGLTHGAAKGDLKYTEKGPMIGEIAGRLSGGYMSGWTFPYSTGIDLTGAALDLAAGKRPETLRKIKEWTSAERAWISIPGKIASVSGYGEAEKLAFVLDIFPRVNPGDTVCFPQNNVEKCGNIIAAGPSREQVIDAAEEACRLILPRLEAPNPETDSFLLAGSAEFPPPAFPLPAFPQDPEYTVSVFSGKQIAVPGFLVPFLDTAEDWQGRTLRRAITQSIEAEPGLLRKLEFSEKNDQNNLNRYWKALLRGGIQGIVYIYDRDSLYESP